MKTEYQQKFAWDLQPEDSVLIRRIQSGDNGAFDELLTRHRGLVCKYVNGYLRRNRYNSQSMADGEAYQAAVLGLWQAARHFDHGRGAAFTTVVGYWLRQALVMARRIRTAERRAKVISLDEYDGLSLSLVAASGVDQDAQGALCEVLDDARERNLLTGRELEVLRLAGAGETLGTASAALGLSRERVRQIRRAAIAKLQHSLGRAAQAL